MKELGMTVNKRGEIVWTSDRKKHPEKYKDAWEKEVTRNRVSKSKGFKGPLTSYHKHAINALLNQPGWTMSKAEKYVRTLSDKEVQRLAHKDM